MTDIDVSHYNTGTATIANGDVAVVGQGTTWTSVRNGDMFGTHVGDGVRILEILDETHLTLAYPWTGPSQTEAVYEIQRTPYDIGYLQRLEELITLLNSGNLESLAGLIGAPDQLPIFTGPGTFGLINKNDLISGIEVNGEAEDMAGRAVFDNEPAGFLVYVVDVGNSFGTENVGRAAIFYKKSNALADWSDPGYVTGPIGPAPVLEIGTVTTGLPGTNADVSLDLILGGYEINFTIPAGAGFYWQDEYNPANEYAKDFVVRSNGSSFIALQPVPAGEAPSGSFPPVDTAYWAVLASKGADGNITGVTPFWQSRITVDEDAASARSGLGGIPYINKSSGLERVLVGGLIQSSDSSGWQFVADSGHESAGFAVGDISQTTSYIRVPFEVAGAKVRTLLVTPDDAYSMLGLTVGASIGLAQADIYLGLPLFAGVKYDPANGNAFYGHPAVVAGLSVAHNSGRLTVTHGPIFDQTIQPTVGNMRGGWGGSAIEDHPSAGVLEVGGTGAGNQFDVQNAAPMSAKVRWVSGTTFAVDTDHAGTFTATWNAGTNTLTVVHPRAQSLYDFSATTLGNKLFPSNVSATGFNMQFQNSAGTILTTPDAFFNFHFTRAASFQRLAAFPSRYFSFARGQVRVDPNKVYGGGGGLLLWGLIKG